MQDAPIKEDATRFIDLGLNETLLHGIYDLGFHYCTPIQAQTLPETLLRQDAIGHSQTGTGKTAAFLITIIDTILNHRSDEARYASEPRAAIIAPTRELALQIAQDAKDLCKYTNITTATLIGGMDYEKQRRLIQDQVIEIVIATPGRLLDFLSQKALFLDQLEVLVLDEADRMLDMGFIPQVTNIVRASPSRESRQTLLFSATFPEEVLKLAANWTLNPLKVAVAPDQVTTKNIDQKLYLVAAKDKYKILLNLLRQKDLTQAIIFANRRDETRRLTEFLKKNGIQCAMLSGEVAQNLRIKTLENLRSGKVPILVATDVAGRGIHVDNISHVINFSLPEDPEDYIHRIGRTGRASASGTAISFACEDDSFLIPALEELLKAPLECLQPPEELLR
ncbi:MAG: DEAD/DEAH box helicase [Pseudomonadales bacterium]|nr:DEAD/DEAH box helicase [Pseudomonadales bacterium]